MCHQAGLWSFPWGIPALGQALPGTLNTEAEQMGAGEASPDLDSGLLFELVLPVCSALGPGQGLARPLKDSLSHSTGAKT